MNDTPNHSRDTSASALNEGAENADVDPHARLEAIQARALEHTRLSLEHMKKFGIQPEGQVGLFLPPSSRQDAIHRLPYTHNTRQVVTYETEAGEFSALCPFSGLPDYGALRIEYMPDRWILELKSLKYYLVSWRTIGATQEDITAYIYEDLLKELEAPHFLVVTTVYNVRGGINTTCSVDSRAS